MSNQCVQCGSEAFIQKDELYCDTCQLKADMKGYAIEADQRDEGDAYHVYWDSECQCELMRGTKAQCIDTDASGHFGGGNYNIYQCVLGYHIVQVFPRSEENPKLRILMEED